MPEPLNILLLEDHPVICEGIKSTLDGQYHVDAVSSCEQASTLFQEKEFCLIVSDIRLQNKQSAFSFLSSLATHPEIPVAIYSSYINPWLFFRFRKIGLLPKAVIEKTEIPDWDKLFDDLLNRKTCFSDAAIAALHACDSDPALLDLLKISDHKFALVHHFLRGYDDKTIAGLSGLKKNTINSYRKDLYKICNVGDIPSLIIKFRHYGYFEIES